MRRKVCTPVRLGSELEVLDAIPLLLAEGGRGEVTSLRQAALAGPEGECLVVWEADRSVARLELEARVVRAP